MFLKIYNGDFMPVIIRVINNNILNYNPFPYYLLKILSTFNIGMNNKMTKNKTHFNI